MSKHERLALTVAAVTTAIWAVVTLTALLGPVVWKFAVAVAVTVAVVASCVHVSGMPVPPWLGWLRPGWWLTPRAAPVTGRTTERLEEWHRQVDELVAAGRPWDEAVAAADHPIEHLEAQFSQVRYGDPSRFVRMRPDAPAVSALIGGCGCVIASTEWDRLASDDLVPTPTMERETR